MDKDLKTILKEKMGERRMSTPRLGKRLGIPPDRIYAWYRDDTNPKGPDSLTIKKWVDDETFSVKDEETSNIGEMTKGDAPPPQEEAKEQMVDNLARALADQAEANKIQAAANDKYAEGFRSLAVILERMESKMAQQTSQAIIEQKTKSIELSLADARKVLATLERRQHLAIEEIRDQFLKVAAGKKIPLKGARKKSGQSNGNG